ncbi:MAG: ECF transporter S component [Defluviitaleaceae bacterium]|nr:ECF transporter S component [Defluviitaleaceae bacterium]
MNEQFTKRVDTRKLCVLAMMCALAFLLAAYVRIPIVLFLRYDPKDVIIVIAGFLFGPLAAFFVTVVVSLMQMLTGVSRTGYFGLFMNIVSSAAFCCTAAIIYKKKRTFKGAFIGLVVAGIFATAVMMMWNYIVAPLFMEMPREDIVRLLIPAFLPFNLVSNGLNIVFTIVLYKRVGLILNAMRMMPRTEESGTSASYKGLVLSALFIIVTCVLWVLIIMGVI